MSNTNFPVTSGLTVTTTNATSGPLLTVDSIDYVAATFGKESAFWFIGNLAATDQVQVPTTMDQNNISSFTTLANTTGNINVNTTGITTGTIAGNNTGAITVSSTGSSTGVNTGIATVNNTNTNTTSGITSSGNASSMNTANKNTSSGNAAPVPEPSTILILGLGFLSLAGIRKKLQQF
ncbi:MAG: PEP-CTERM sorting domain-containing protein [Methanobacterium sp.]